KVHTVNRDDINLDNHPDLMFQRSDTGGLLLWLMDEAFQTSVGAFSPSNPGSAIWRLAGSGDLNADGNMDLIWQNKQTGDLAYFLMNGPSLIPNGVGFFNPSRPGPAWKLVSVCDLNGDFSPDLIFQNQTNGYIAYWLMNGTTRVIGGLFSPYNPGSPAWKLVASYHNYTANTTTLYFRSAQSGALGYWVMDAGQVMMNSGLLNPPIMGSPDWRFAALEDVNGDGQPDIVWQNMNTGAVAYWLMNGTSQIGSDLFYPTNAGYPLWQVAGAH
ncbi:MAG TPA: VCBS repeat-containing protein, partial [Chthonomonadales bacterium]|nr:VCBS repeat-containing protein [Chthonomonadales bacterium]